MKTNFSYLVLFLFFLSPFAEASCGGELAGRIRQARLLESLVLKHFPSDQQLDPLKKIDLLWASAELSAPDGWAPLGAIRNQAKVSVNDSSAKRIMSQFYAAGWWISKDDPAMRTRRLVKLTELGRDKLRAFAADYFGHTPLEP